MPRRASSTDPDVSVNVNHGPAMHDHDFQTQAVRDLAWALTSPSMMAHPFVVDEDFGAHELARHRGLLARLDKPGSPLTKALSRAKSRRLGEYFETLITTWLSEVPAARVIASNWQVYGKGGTTGEFDLLFERDRITWHWELAIKYYLGHPGPDGESLWYGPNPRDRLDRKWHRMLDHQLRLAEHDDARKALSRLDIRSPIHSRAFVKGYLFEPLDARYAVDVHESINRDGLRGWWVHSDRINRHRERLDPESKRGWVKLPRQRWMSPARHIEGDRVLTMSDLVASLPWEHPTMVAGMEESKRGVREVTRGFIMPPGWLER